MHIDNVIFLILSKIAYTKFSVGPTMNMIQMRFYRICQFLRQHGHLRPL